MKKLLSGLLIILLSAIVISGCTKSDSANPSINPSGIEDYDFIQLTNDNPDLPVTIAIGDDKSIDSVVISAYPEGSATRVAYNTLRNITFSSLTSLIMKVPFPLPAAGGASGVYTIEYTIYDKSGKKTTKSYNINLSNLKTAVVIPCSFPNLPLPPGKNVWLFVTAPANTPAGDDLYVSGNFEGWTGGGNPNYKFTKISNTCFYIALNLAASDEFKITRGSWGTVIKGPNGEELNNITWNGTGSQFFTIPNWADRVVLPPLTIPNSAIGTGKVTVVVDVDSPDPVPQYFLVKKGATSLTGAIPLARISAGGSPSNKVCVAVPKDAATQYWVVKDDMTKIGINAYGYEQEVVWDGKTNPVNMFINRYKNQGPLVSPITTLVLVGGATPGGWNNPNPAPASQTFTSAGTGKFAINSLALSSTNGGFLALPVAGNWGMKWGARGSATSGNVIWDGPDFQPPSTSGNYKIEIDFYRGIYKLTKL